MENFKLGGGPPISATTFAPAFSKPHSFFHADKVLCASRISRVPQIPIFPIIYIIIELCVFLSHKLHSLFKVTLFSINL